MDLVPDDFDVGTLFLQHGARLGADRLSERIVLVYEVDLLDVRPILHEGRERRHLDVGIGVPAEVPVGALGVGQGGVDGGIIEVDDLLAGIAIVVLGHPVGEAAATAELLPWVMTRMP